MELNDNGRVGVFILDDHQMLIDGIKALLAHSRKYDVIGEETDGHKALIKIKDLNPQLIITDISMPAMDGAEFTKKVRAFNTDIKICALSMHSEKSIITEMLQSGINGYVLKNTGKLELIEALDKIMEGHYFISNSISFDFLVSEKNNNISANALNPIKLTERESEILKLIAQEYSNLQIANSLFISERTVETHRKNIFRKTNTKSVVGLIKYAFEHQLI